MKKTPAVVLASMITLGSGFAATTVLDLSLSQTTGDTSSKIGGADSGTVALVEGTFNGTEGSLAYTYTISDLNLDGIGGNDDTVTFNLKLWGTSNGNVATSIDAAYGAWGVNGSRVDAGETLKFTMGAAPTVTLGAGATDPAPTVTFNQFTNFQGLNLATTEVFDITGTTGSDQTGITGNGNYTEFTLTQPEDEFTLATTTGGIRWKNIQTSLTINTVPEPSSAALLGLGGLALILRRRK